MVRLPKIAVSDFILLKNTIDTLVYDFLLSLPRRVGAVVGVAGRTAAA